MRQKDVALYLVIAFISAITAFFVSSKLIVTPEKRQQEVVMVEPISETFEKPTDTYFNGESINPTQMSLVGQPTNQTPFNGTGQ
ncbi:MAG: hypothetical protein WBO35_04245 [Candidatus Saccharimonadales bacterium]|jgi:hypothetical protein